MAFYVKLRDAFIAVASRLLVLLLTLLLMEAAVRFLGYRPANSGNTHNSVHLDDQRRGWTSRPGIHTLQNKDQDVHTETILEPGLRFSGTSTGQAEKSIALYGCSIAYGFGLDDKDTLAWKLQEQLQNTDVLNFAVSGYGTYQSVLDFEDRAKKGLRPDLTLYLFPEFHAARNVGQSSYLRALARNSSRGNIHAPRCKFEKNSNSCGRVPTSAYYPEIPFRDAFALVHLLEEVYVALRDRNREEYSREATESLLLEFSEIAKSVNSEFVVLLYNEEAFSYEAFLKEQGIESFRLYEPRFKEQEYLLANDGHPNARLTSEWAKKLLPLLKKKLSNV